MTVAVLEQAASTAVEFNPKDFKIEWYSGTGAGGQHRNKHQNSCRITHIETGLIVTAQCRSRENSLAEAKATIVARLDTRRRESQSLSQASNRKSQVGSGERGDKIRTYRFQDNTTKDHQTGKAARTDVVMAGNFNLLW